MDETRIVAVPDLHHPWTDRRQIDTLLAFMAKHDPTHVVQLGDAYDLFTFAQYPRPSSFITPAVELRTGREAFEAFWSATQQAAPHAEYHQLLGNHDTRISRMVASKAPELDAVMEVLDLHSLWRFPGVMTATSARHVLEIGDVAFHHGDFVKGTAMGGRVKHMLRKIVFGHTHKAHVYYLPRYEGALWEMGCGVIALTDELPFAYTPIKYPDSVHGFGYIDGYGPRVIPFN